MQFFTPKAIQNLCQQYGLKPSKDYGQNYLLSLEPIEAMIAAAEIKKTDTVVEVGPGFGALTFGLAEAAGKVIAFEIEKKIKPYWDEKLKEYPNVEIVWGDVLRHPTPALPFLQREGIASLSPPDKGETERGTRTDKSLSPPDKGETERGTRASQPYKVVANIPYQITSPIIKLFLEDVENKPESLTLMVQKEVAQRICAKPGDMSVLAVAVQYFAEPEIITYVPRHFFYPIPKVDSAVIKITLREPTPPIIPSKEGDKRNPTPALPFLQREGASPVSPPDKGETERGTRADDSFSSSLYKKGRTEVGSGDKHKQFFKLVKTGFSSRRKILIKNLLPLIGGNSGPKILEDFWQKNNWSRTIRAQELSVGDWIKLAQILSRSYPHTKKDQDVV